MELEDVSRPFRLVRQRLWPEIHNPTIITENTPETFRVLKAQKHLS